MPSTTLSKGVKSHVELDPASHKIYNVSYDGDIYYGRSGNYFTSFFLFQAIITNNIKGKTLQESLKVLQKLTQDSKNMAAPAYCMDKSVDQAYLEGIFEELMRDVQSAIDNYSDDEDAQKKILEGLIDRWLDARAHSPLSFNEREVNKEEEERKLSKQKEALGMLNAFEQKLQRIEAAVFPKNVHLAIREGLENVLLKILESTPKALLEKHINDTDLFGYTPLMTAARLGSVKMVQYLLDHGADPDYTPHGGNISALHVAVETGHGEIVKLLLARNVDVNRQKSPDNFSPIFLACMFGYLEITEMLLNANANVNLVDDSGKTPLFYAAEYGHLGCVKALLEHHAKVDVRDIDNNTPLHKLCSNSCGVDDVIGSEFFEVAQLLLQGGADTKLKNNEGETAKDTMLAAEKFQMENGDEFKRKFDGDIRKKIIELLDNS